MSPRSGTAAIPARLDRRSLRRGVDELARSDRDLARVVERFGPPPLWARPPGFATLVRIVLEQQVSLASGRATYERLVAGVGPGAVTAERLRRFTPAQLRRLGITRQKAGYCIDLAEAVATGELPLAQVSRMTPEDAHQTLVQVRGIGPWTADVYLLMALRRPDVWPDGDVALVESARRVKRLRARPDRDRMRRIARAWRPWRAVAARILWHGYLSERNAA